MDTGSEASVIESMKKGIEQLVVKSFDTAIDSFFVPEAVDALLLYYLRTKDQKYLDTAGKALQRLLENYDGVEGGFFSGMETHEKSLELNTGILLNYLHMYQVTGKEAYRKVAESIVNYINRNLFANFFYCSQVGDKKYYSERSRTTKKPPVDKTLYVNLNSEAICAYLEASAVLGDSRLRSQALSALSFIMSFGTDHGTFHCYDGSFKGSGMLADNIVLCRALVAASEHGEPFLGEAQHIADYIMKNFWSGNAFYVKISGENLPFMENAVAAEVFAELYAITGNEKYQVAAKSVLGWAAGVYENYEAVSAAYVRALEKLENFVTVSVVDYTDEMIKDAWSVFEPAKIIIPLSPEDGEKKGYGRNRAFFICGLGRCFHAADRAGIEKYFAVLFKK